MGQMHDACKTTFNYVGREIKLPNKHFDSRSSNRKFNTKPNIVSHEIHNTSWITEDSWQSENSTPSPTQVLPLPAEYEDLPEPLTLTSMQVNLESEADSEDTIIQEVSVMMSNVQPSNLFPEISFNDRLVIAQRMEGLRCAPRVKNSRYTEGQNREIEEDSMNRFLSLKKSKEFRKSKDTEPQLNSFSSYSKENNLLDVNTLLDMAEARLSTDTQTAYIPQQHTPNTSKLAYNPLSSFDSSFRTSLNNTIYSTYDQSFRSVKLSHPRNSSKSSKPSQLSRPPRQTPKVVTIDLSTQRFISRNPTPKRSTSNNRKTSTSTPRCAPSSHSKEPLGHISSNYNLPLRRNSNPKPNKDPVISSSWAENRKIREKLKEYYS